MSEYVKTCIFCKQEIQMSDKESKWLPYNKDGSAHDCRNKQDTTTQQKQEQKPEWNQETLERIADSLERIAEILKKIDLEALMSK